MLCPGQRIVCIKNANSVWLFIKSDKTNVQSKHGMSLNTVIGHNMMDSIDSVCLCIRKIIEMTSGNRCWNGISNANQPYAIANIHSGLFTQFVTWHSICGQCKIHTIKKLGMNASNLIFTTYIANVWKPMNILNPFTYNSCSIRLFIHSCGESNYILLALHENRNYLFLFSVWQKKEENYEWRKRNSKNMKSALMLKEDSWFKITRVTLAAYMLRSFCACIFVFMQRTVDV